MSEYKWATQRDRLQHATEQLYSSLSFGAPETHKEHIMRWLRSVQDHAFDAGCNAQGVNNDAEVSKQVAQAYNDGVAQGRVLRDHNNKTTTIHAFNRWWGENAVDHAEVFADINTARAAFIAGWEYAPLEAKVRTPKSFTTWWATNPVAHTLEQLAKKAYSQGYEAAIVEYVDEPDSVKTKAVHLTWKGAVGSTVSASSVAMHMSWRGDGAIEVTLTMPLKDAIAIELFKFMADHVAPDPLAKLSPEMGRVFVPLTEAEIKEALKAGGAEREAAEASQGSETESALRFRLRRP